jgi:hypothetical protein
LQREIIGGHKKLYILCKNADRKLFLTKGGEYMKNNTNNSMVITVIVALVVAGLSFFGGMKYQESKRPAGFNRLAAGAAGAFGAGGGAGMRTGGNRGGFRPVSGEILSTDDKSITVKLTDGSSRIVLVNDKTQINKASNATKTDLKVGEKVSVFGADNTDGSVTAQNIQLNPIMRVPSGSPGPQQ